MREGGGAYPMVLRGAKKGSIVLESTLSAYCSAARRISPVLFLASKAG
jgi:hypothetical protein